MSTWAQRRKFTYTLTFLALVTFIIIVPLYLLYRDPPSCTDGKRNQGEAGVDCGGPCRNLCQARQLSPTVSWARPFRVTSNIYSAAAYIENPNISARAEEVPYVFKLLDKNGQIIAERRGVAFIPPRTAVVVFEGGIQIYERIPVRALFEFTEEPFWQPDLSSEFTLDVQSQRLSGTDVPKFDAVLRNATIRDFETVSAVAVVYNAEGNAIAASRTYVDLVVKNSTVPVTFTWPEPFSETPSRAEVYTTIHTVK